MCSTRRRAICTSEQCDSAFGAMQLKALIKPTLRVCGGACKSISSRESNKRTELFLSYIRKAIHIIQPKLCTNRSILSNRLRIERHLTATCLFGKRQTKIKSVVRLNPYLSLTYSVGMGNLVIFSFLIAPCGGSAWT